LLLAKPYISALIRYVEVGRLEQYRVWLSKSKSRATADQYYWYVRRFLRSLDRPLEEVGPLEVAEYIDGLERSTGPSTARMAAYAIRLFFRLLGRSDWALIPTPVAYVHREPRWLLEERVGEVAESCRDPLDRALISTAYEAALRRGEAVILDRSSYDPAERALTVRRLKRRTSPTHTVPLRGWCIGHLEGYLGSRTDDHPAMFAVRSRGRRSGWGRISRGTIHYRWYRAARRAGIDPRRYTFHCLRHSRGTNLAIRMIEESGRADVVRLAKFMGHVSPSSTMQYIHLAHTYLREVSGG